MPAKRRESISPRPAPAAARTPGRAGSPGGDLALPRSPPPSPTPPRPERRGKAPHRCPGREPGPGTRRLPLPCPLPAPSAPASPGPTHRCAAPAGPPAGTARTGRRAARGGPRSGAGAAWAPRGAPSSQPLGSRATRSGAGPGPPHAPGAPRGSVSAPRAARGRSGSPRVGTAGGAWGGGTRGDHGRPAPASALAHRRAPRLRSPGASRSPARSQARRKVAAALGSEVPVAGRGEARGGAGAPAGEWGPSRRLPAPPSGPGTRTQARTASCTPSLLSPQLGAAFTGKLESRAARGGARGDVPAPWGPGASGWGRRPLLAPVPGNGERPPSLRGWQEEALVRASGHFLHLDPDRTGPRPHTGPDPDSSP